MVSRLGGPPEAGHDVFDRDVSGGSKAAHGNKSEGRSEGMFPSGLQASMR
jgi:hypothetical protein